MNTQRARRNLTIAAVLASCAAVLFVSYEWAKLQVDWTVVSSARSPSGRMTVYHLKSNDSGVGLAPYGNHVVLSDSLFPFAKYSAPPVFAGYCTLVKYRWNGDRDLMIE